MTSAQIVVTLLGLAAIAWINWYFFLASRGSAAGIGMAVMDGGLQRIHVEVKGGYTPSLVRVRAGVPVRLEFHRDETSTCTEEVVLPDFGIRTFLPVHRTTSVSFTPAEGTYEFTCGMGMVRGKIVAEKNA
jgi:plastocyanin domain-containing protein